MLAILLAGCSRSSNPHDSVAGQWTLHWGKATEKLILSDSNGVLQGTVTLDLKWGGSSYAVNGLRVGNEVEFSYLKKDHDGAVNYLFKGKREPNRMSGKCTLSIITGPESTTDDALWIAEKESVAAK
jgi:hypothetical protein